MNIMLRKYYAKRRKQQIPKEMEEIQNDASRDRDNWGPNNTSLEDPPITKPAAASSTDFRHHPWYVVEEICSQLAHEKSRVAL